MSAFYVTFGTDPNYPYTGRGEYVKVIADSRREANEKFRKRHPNPRPGNEDVLNYAWMYTEFQWENIESRCYLTPPVLVETIT
jgi:hypothetical protein